MIVRLLLLICVLYAPIRAIAGEPIDPNDWPTYNHDVVGWRYNPAEQQITPATADRLTEKWRFPAKGSPEVIGVIHATPVVVNGYVYFGTATYPAFYKLKPNGQQQWVYHLPKSSLAGSYINPTTVDQGANKLGTSWGIMGSAMVTDRYVFFGDIVGVFYALDRFTGKEVWKVNTKIEPFPGAHPVNTFMSSPILADGKVIVGGGANEHPYPLFPDYPCCTGRGFVIALEPDTGKIVWKYDVGPEPEEFVTPVTIEDANGKHVFLHGPATSSVWSTPSYDRETNMVFFGTDVQNAPRRPTESNPRLDTPYSSAVIAVDGSSGRERWVTQINQGDVFNRAMSAYDYNTGRYKDQAIGDTPKIYEIAIDGNLTKLVGVGCKDGGYYVFRADNGKLISHTPTYRGPPRIPLEPKPDKQMIALPSVIGGLQTGCATDGKRVFTNGIDHLRFAARRGVVSTPTGGRVVCIDPSAKREFWRHERPKTDVLLVRGGSIREFKDIGDPVASGIAVAGGVISFTTTVSNHLVFIDSATGRKLKEIELGPTWCGPSISRGRVYVGTGNTLFSKNDPYFRKKTTGHVLSFGLPENDEVDRMGEGSERRISTD